MGVLIEYYANFKFIRDELAGKSIVLDNRLLGKYLPEIHLRIAKQSLGKKYLRLEYNHEGDIESIKLNLSRP